MLVVGERVLDEHDEIIGSSGFYIDITIYIEITIDRPVPHGAVIGERFLACPSAATWSLHTRDHDPVEVDVPDGYVRSIAVDGESFVVLAEQRQTDAASTYRMIRVSVSGDVTIGPQLPPMQGSPRPFLTGSPLRVFRGSVAMAVLPDLTYWAIERLGADSLFHGGQIGDFVWMIGHPPDGTSRTGWWPLPGPVEYERPRQFWLFTLLDAGTLEPVTCTPIFATNPAVTIAPAGTVWVIAADGLQCIPEESMHWSTSLDVATLLDETRRQ